MRLQIDNLDGGGFRDYTSTVDLTNAPEIIRTPEKQELRVSLISVGADFVVPPVGARVVFGLVNGHNVFTGWISEYLPSERLGWGEAGPTFRHNLIAQGDGALLDEKRVPDMPPFVNRSAGDALRRLTQATVGTTIDVSGVQNLDSPAGYFCTPRKDWSQIAAEIATQARGSCRVQDNTLIFTPLGQQAYMLDEDDPEFTPANLKLAAKNSIINDVTVVGEIEPQAYVRDYFVGDGLTSRFYLSQSPFVNRSRTVVNEEYAGSALNANFWSVIDPLRAVSVNNGQLQIAGGTGQDGGTTVTYAEQVELAGAQVLKHGDVKFLAPSSAVIGGLYNGSIATKNCVAGFQIAPSGSQSKIQAIVNGSATGPVITTISGHHYVMTTRIYSQEMFRRQQSFHSSLHPAGNAIGGGVIAANVRMVMDVHDIDPLNQASQIAPAQVLWDGIISNAPAFFTYATVNASNLQCSIAFTQIIQAPDAEVRSALPGQGYGTRLVGTLRDGAECQVTSSGTLEFYSQHIPAANELIEVHYRDAGRAVARITNPASISALQHGSDDGVRGTIQRITLPPARSTADCENAALAILEDSTTVQWSGTYETWSDFLPGGAADIYPGDALDLNVEQAGGVFSEIVKQIQITIRDLAGEHSWYKIGFASATNPDLAFQFENTSAFVLPPVSSFTNLQVGNIYLSNLTGAAITQVTSTTISVDAGTAAPSGGGFEVRWSDDGWGATNDRNLVGRFSSRTFALPRLSKSQTCYLRQYDASVPPRYSRYSAALHADFPL